MRIAAISDVTIGYGTPQIPALVSSVAGHFGGDVSILEPAQPELPPRHDHFPFFQFHRIATTVHPHSVPGRAEYVWHGARILNQLRPDVLIVGCTYSLPVLFKLRRRPELVIYYCLESVPFYGPFDVELNRHLDGRADVVIFPEENRAVMEVSRSGFHGISKVVMLNATSHAADLPAIRPRAARNGRILYAGTINRDQTFADYFTDRRMSDFAIDMFGPLRFGDAGQRNGFLQALLSNVRYHGTLGADRLNAIRGDYIYSLVAWNPTNENQRFAAPNKLFESIAAGVPPIAAPHPQCQEIIHRHRCGVVMDDWSFDAFRHAIHRALALYETDVWDRMVANCARAARLELNWDAQFQKLLPYLTPRKHG